MQLRLRLLIVQLRKSPNHSRLILLERGKRLNVHVGGIVRPLLMMLGPLLLLL